MDELLVNFVHGSFPWATEDAAVRLASLARGHNIKSTVLAVAISKVSNSGDVQQIKKLITDANNEATKAARKTESNSTKIKKEMSSVNKSLSSSNGLSAIADLTYAGAKALNRLGEAGADLISKAGISGEVIGGLVSFTGTAAVATAGVGVVFAELLTAQEKTVRAMMDYGLVVGDRTLYTDLRDRVANFAMSIEDYTAIIEQTKQVMTRTNSDAFAGQQAFAAFVGEVKANDNISKFGMSPQDLAKQLAAETATLFKVNEITELNAAGKQRVLESFDTVNRLSLFMANAFGIQRSDAVKLRLAARENADFATAIYQNGNYVREKYGEDATKNINDANEFLYTMMSSSLGEEFANESAQIFANTLQDISFDTSAVNNMSTEFLEKLQRIGPEVAQMYIGLVEDSVQGKVNADDMVLRARQFTQTIAKSTGRISNDQIGLESTKIRAAARATPGIMNDISEQDIQALTQSAAAASKQAGLSIEVVGDVAVAFQEIKNKLTPGYDTMTDAFAILVESGQAFGETWSKLFGSGKFRTVEERQAAMLTADQERAFVAQVGAYDSGSFQRNQNQEAERQLIESNQEVRNLESALEAATATNNNGEITRLNAELAQAKRLQESKRQQLLDVGAGRTTIPLISRDSNAAEINSLNGGLLDFIGSGEGGYGASNRGTSGGKIIGSTMDGTIRNGKPLEEMTFAEIFALQSIRSPSDPNRLFAVGKYQIIPDTMKEIFPHSGLKLSDTFSTENQDKLGTLLIVGNDGYAKRRNLSAFVRGESNDMNSAMLDFAKEWASAPDPRTGLSYYGNGNRASHSREQVAAALNAAREQYAKTHTIETSAQPEVQASVSTQTAAAAQVNIPQVNSNEQTTANNANDLSDKRTRLLELDRELSTSTSNLTQEMSGQRAREEINSGK
jgi:hypothetical protein